jgi:GNAT superfamily N-acetyltransferase
MAEVQTLTYRIRYATQSDVTQILQLIQELASYEKALHEVLATEATLRSSLSFPNDPSDLSKGFSEGYAKTILILPRDGSDDGKEGTVAGMALYFHNYSTWQSRPGIYLEDLFVRPVHRGKGYGTALIQALARECVRLDCRRLEWSVLKWNEPSIKFYQGPSVGAERMEEWVGMRVEGEGLKALAAKGEVAK